MPLFSKSPTKEESGATQEFVDIQGIKDGIMILKDSSFRVLLEVSSINFALKGTDEQNAIILQFQEFLNSLDFPLQISVTSRKLDIEPYLNFLTQLSRQQENELLKIQTEEYLNFIKGLVELQNIMTKKFYIIVPLYRPKAAVSAMMGKKKTPEQETLSAEEYNKSKNQLLQRADHVILGIRRMGLKSRMLDSEEILRLLVQLYNPTTAIKEMEMPSTGLANYT